jgi:hypothetical protein
VTEPFIPANPLEVMMVEAQAGRMEMTALMTALLSSPLYVAPGGDSGEGELALAALEGRHGGRYIPAFTARSRLERFSGSDRAASVPLRDLAAAWPPEVSLVVDPGDPVELVLPGHELRRIAGGEPPEGEQTVPAGTPVMIGDPADEPEAALAAVAATCSGVPAVLAAYRAQVHVDRPGERPHLAIGLVLDPAANDHDQLRRAVAQSATSAGIEQVSVVLIDPEAKGDAIAAYMLERTEPFFSRAYG